MTSTHGQKNGCTENWCGGEVWVGEAETINRFKGLGFGKKNEGGNEEYWEVPGVGWIHFIVPDLVSGKGDGDEVEAEMWRERQCKGDGRAGRWCLGEREKDRRRAGVNTSGYCGSSESEKLNRSRENGNEKGDREMWKKGVVRKNEREEELLSGEELIPAAV